MTIENTATGANISLRTVQYGRRTTSVTSSYEYYQNGECKHIDNITENNVGQAHVQDKQEAKNKSQTKGGTIQKANKTTNILYKNTVKIK
jgi:hypothetical protein